MFTGKRLFWAVLLAPFFFGVLAAVNTLANAQQGLGTAHTDVVPIDKLLKTFLVESCNDCHGEGSKEGGFELGKLGTRLDDPATFTKWERIFDRVDSGEMPPREHMPLSESGRKSFLKKLGETLRTAHHRTKGTKLRRLNRVEYENTLNDLFGTRLRIAEMLPEDARSGEFDNIGNALGLSMVHLRKYVDAIEMVLDEAIAKYPDRPQPKTVRGDYASTREGPQFIGKVWKKLDDGAVVRFSGGGYPSGMMRNANVREAGRYRIRVTGYAYQSKIPVTFSVGGTTFRPGAEKPVFGYFAFRPGAPQTIELVTDIPWNYMIQIEPYGIFDPERYKRKSIDDYQGSGLAIKSVEVIGPLVDEYPSRGHRLIFDGLDRREKEPRNPREKLKPWYRPTFEVHSTDEVGDARKSLRRVTAAAFRREVSETEVEGFVELFKTERAEGSTFEQSLRLAIVAVFCSPDFLYLVENGNGTRADSTKLLDDYEIATRLSYFLHRSFPDKRLLNLASKGKLANDSASLKAETERLLSHHRFSRFVKDFTDAWLNLRELDFTAPDAQLFPEYDEYLRFSMPLETRSLFDELIRSNHPIRNIVKSEFAMLNDRLAIHYGLPGVTGSEIRKVALPKESVRGGFLTQASVLKVSANGTNTSPVVRGVWVMERILGETPQPPPPGIPGVEPDIRGATTLRELLKKHRDSTNCQVCHQRIDPPGFALESFNPIGGFRERYRSLGEGDRVALKINGRNVRYRLGPKVDSSGTMLGLAGKPSDSLDSDQSQAFHNFSEFRERLLVDQERLARSFTQKLLTFATGREMGFSDRLEIDQIVQRASRQDFRMRDLLHLVVASKIFQSE